MTAINMSTLKEHKPRTPSTPKGGTYCCCHPKTLRLLLLGVAVWAGMDWYSSHNTAKVLMDKAGIDTEGVQQLWDQLPNVSISIKFGSDSDDSDSDDAKSPTRGSWWELANNYSASALQLANEYTSQTATQLAENFQTLRDLVVDPNVTLQINVNSDEIVHLWQLANNLSNTALELVQDPSSALMDTFNSVASQLVKEVEELEKEEMDDDEFLDEMEEEEERDAVAEDEGGDNEDGNGDNEGGDATSEKVGGNTSDKKEETPGTTEKTPKEIMRANAALFQERKRQRHERREKRKQVQQQKKQEKEEAAHKKQQQEQEAARLTLEEEIRVQKEKDTQAAQAAKAAKMEKKRRRKEAGAKKQAKLARVAAATETAALRGTEPAAIPITNPPVVAASPPVVETKKDT